VGLLFNGVDLREAWARMDAPTQAGRWIGEKAAGRTVWYTGHWGFQYYAERLGMTALEPGRTLVRQGDWLVVPDDSVHHQGMRLELAPVRLQATVRIEDWLPLETVWCFYGSTTGVGIHHHEGPRVGVKIYSARQDFIPVPAPELTGAD
jgi:hypothetical protein